MEGAYYQQCYLTFWHAPLFAMGFEYPLHRDLWGILVPVIPFTLLGILLGWTRLATGSVWPAVLGHAGIDSQQLMGALLIFTQAGVSYDTMTAEDMVVVDLDGNRVEGTLNPSSDTPTHVEIYKAFKGVKAVVHTHSKWATSWAQANKDIPALGTTHSDNFYGAIPCTRRMTEAEITGTYEKDTGSVIIETFNGRGIDPLQVSAVIVATVAYILPLL
jgi:L-ribulose-5-phosphate 4-epimerase